mgnify:CR=1 FL=1|tara:strand:+ start:870 stop:1223 length:354 start_codon:yes stop_codon:yes gene_type:complete
MKQITKKDIEKYADLTMTTEQQKHRERQLSKIETPYGEHICPSCLEEGELHITNDDDDDFITQIHCDYGGCGFVILEDYNIDKTKAQFKQKLIDEEMVDTIYEQAKKLGLKVSRDDE